MSWRRKRRAGTRDGSAWAAATSCSPAAAPRARCSPSTRRTPRRAARAASSTSRPSPRPSPRPRRRRSRPASSYSPRSHLACLSSEEFVKDVFLDSDTDMMVLSFVPARRDASPLEVESADNVRRIVDRLEGNHRLMIHGRVNPNQPGDLEDMPRLKERFGVCAWKTYTQWGLDGKGFYLDDEVGIRFVEEARRLGVTVICVHKGLPFGQQSY